MLGAIDIHKFDVISKSIVEETKELEGNFVLTFFYKLFIKRKNSKLIKKLDKFSNVIINAIELEKTLTLEDERAETLALEMLDHVKVMIRQYIEIKQEYQSKARIFYSEDVVASFNKTLKALYKFESVLQKKIYKNKPVLKTPDDIKEGITKMNVNNFNRLLEK